MKIFKDIEILSICNACYLNKEKGKKLQSIILGDNLSYDLVEKVSRLNSISLNNLLSTCDLIVDRNKDKFDIIKYTVKEEFKTEQDYNDYLDHMAYPNIYDDIYDFLEEYLEDGRR